MERVLILSAGVGSGHNSAAHAIERACGARPDVEAAQVLDVLETGGTLYRELIGKGYFVLADGVPWLVEWGYDVSDRPFRRRGPIDPWTRVNALPAVRAAQRFRPSVIICTHFLPAQLIAGAVLRGSITARTAVVTTDYDFQGLWLTSVFHRMFMARAEGRAQLAALGLPVDRVQDTGIPIVTEAPDEVRPEPGPPMLLVSAGAAGGDYAVAVTRQLLHLRSDFRATVVCGRNDALQERISRLVAPAGDRFSVLGFTSEMPRLLRTASLFIGKPGGLSSSECMAAGLPMVLVNPIPGQEERNGDYLVEEGAAVKCHTVQTIGWKVDGVLTEPGRLDRMRAAAQRIGRPHAARDVVGSVLDGPRRPLVVTRAAQRTVLAAAERHVAATDLTGPSSLARLVDEEEGSTVALVRTDQLADLRETFRAPGGGLDLRPLSRTDLQWEARRLIAAVLRGDRHLPVRVEDLRAEARGSAEGARPVE